MKYLITGATGAGKSTIAKELKGRDFIAYDSDAETDLVRWENEKGQPIEPPENPNRDWYEHNFWNWNEKGLLGLLGGAEDVFICGGSSNQQKFYKHFDKIFLLTIDEQSMLGRLNTREENSFGKHHEQQASILGWHKRFEKSALDDGAIPVDATLPVSKIVDKILSAKVAS